MIGIETLQQLKLAKKFSSFRPSLSTFYNSTFIAYLWLYAMFLSSIMFDTFSVVVKL